MVSLYLSRQQELVLKRPNSKKESHTCVKLRKSQKIRNIYQFSFEVNSSILKFIQVVKCILFCRVPIVIPEQVLLPPWKELLQRRDIGQCRFPHRYYFQPHMLWSSFKILFSLPCILQSIQNPKDQALWLTLLPDWTSFIDISLFFTSRHSIPDSRQYRKWNSFRAIN